MQLVDLDLDAGEVLKQLFATRRHSIYKHHTHTPAFGSNFTL
jgi:hypothetical protein